jgi:hypothetical protein
MSVQIIWSSTNGGISLAAPIDHGTNSAGNILSPQTLYIRHTGVNPITACGFYVRAWVGSGQDYSGDATPSDDFNELIAWGDAGLSADFGGFEVNMNAVNAFPNASWPVFANKNTADGFGFTFRTGNGSSSGNALILKKESYNAGGVDGQIPAGSSPNVRIQTRIVIPSTETTPGIRMFEQVLKFTFTS